MKPRRAVVVLAALGAVGCGSSSKGPEEVATEVAHSLGAGNVSEACKLMTKPLRKQFARRAGTSNCADALARALAQTQATEKARLRNAKVVSIKVKGDRANVRLTGDTESTAMRKVNGNWMFDVGPTDPALAQATLAKANLRGAVSAIETCYTDLHTYAKCSTGPHGMYSPDVKWGSGPGKVQIETQTKNTYTLASRAANGTTIFRFGKASDGQFKRTCEPASSPGCTRGRW
jgi:hypothetical protein